MSLPSGKTDEPFRIGAPYLNSRPLVWKLVECPSPDLILCEAPPTRLASMVHSGELDAALISSIEACRSSDLELLPEIGVTAAGEIQSIRLFHREPLNRLRSVALDTSSYTSAALTRILLAERYDRRPEFVSMPPNLEEMLDRCDAALLIGDPAMRARHPTIPYIDLGMEWWRHTNLPFVYALWAGNPGVFRSGLSDRLCDSLTYGLTRIDAIAAAEAGPRGLDVKTCRDYLHRIIRYRIGPEEKKGLNRFLAYAGEYNLLESPHENMESKSPTADNQFDSS